MSYCRWSTDSFRCDIYAYESVGDFWVVYVAGNRLPNDAPREIYPTDWNDKKQTEAYFRAHKELSVYMEDCERLPIGGPCDCERFKLSNLHEFKAKMIELKEQGYCFPDSVLTEIDEEIAGAKSQPQENSQ